MCGSGTFLIEGAMMALNMAPGLLRKSFAFQKWKNFQPDTWQEIVNQAVANEVHENSLPFPICGFDKSFSAIKSAKLNVLAAGLEPFISFQRQEINELTLLSVKMPNKINNLKDNLQVNNSTGLLIINPPYGIRTSFQTAQNTSSNHQLSPLENDQQSPSAPDDLDCYKALAHVLKMQFPDWTAWILTGRPSSFTQLKASYRYSVKNGQIDCRFLCYKIRKGPLTKLYLDPAYKSTYSK